MIKKPMKAPSTGANLDELKALSYPIACSAKLDGIRGVITTNGVLSNSLKPIGNQHIQQQLNNPNLFGLDGELIVGSPHINFAVSQDDVFNRTSGNVRRSAGKPDFKFYVFDCFKHKDLSYADRWLNIMGNYVSVNPYVVVLEQRICKTWQEALAYEESLLAQGYEGMMVRSLTAPYKEGRATKKESYILKRKPLEQDEAIIIDCFEQLKNNNVKATNELGDSFRTNHQENKEGKDTLGGFVLKSSRWEDSFNCGTIIGGTQEWRKYIWEQYKANPKNILGQIVTYVYQGIGSLDKPRQPRAKAEFRFPDDL